MYFEYVSLCVFWNWLIYLMPIYYCFYVSWFCFTNWKQIKGMKTNVQQNMHQHFSNSYYSLHLCFTVPAFLWWFYKKKRYSFHCIYWYVTYYVLLCCIWLDVLWSLLVKLFSFLFFQSFQIMTKDKSRHKVIICHFVYMRLVTFDNTILKWWAKCWCMKLKKNVDWFVVSLSWSSLIIRSLALF